MTNKTITLACCTCGKPTACGKMICEECCYEPLPVPPVGGEPEVVYMLRNKSLGTAWRMADKEAYDSMAMVPVYERRELVDRAHFTRLQAEVERLKLLADKRWNDLTEESDKSSAEIYALQAELTKARELIGDLRADTQSGHLRAVQALHNWANQFAPADNPTRAERVEQLNQEIAMLLAEDEVHCTGHVDYDPPTRPHNKGD